MRKHAGSMAIIIVAMITMAGCDDGMMPPINGGGQEPATASYVGNYGATAGQAAVHLEVEEESFVTVTFTGPTFGAQTVQAASIRTATANTAQSESVTWVRFTGDVVVSGSLVTLSIEAVEHDGKALGGAELAEYEACEITATAGAGFAEEVMEDGILECLGSTVDADSVDVRTYEYEEEQPPSELVIGEWGLDADRTFVDWPSTLISYSMRMSISSTELTGSWSQEVECPPDPDSTGFGDQCNSSDTYNFGMAFSSSIVEINDTNIVVRPTGDANAVSVDYIVVQGDRLVVDFEGVPSYHFDRIE